MTPTTKTCAALRQQLDIVTTQRDNAWRERDAARQAPPVFERMQFEKLTRAQLVSFIEQAINESRRKGLVEAEGLVSRYRELSEDTDLETMRGVVKAYSDRIAVLEADRARQQIEKVKLDTRPLSEKLRPAGLRGLDQKPWLRYSTTEFAQFDARAKRVEAEAKARAEATPGTLADQQVVHVKGDTGTIYGLMRQGDVYSCECPAWRHQSVPADRRTCKHLKRHLGAEVEEKRIARPQPSCWCGVILVRGQCQIHTRVWKGDERCNCGRLFSHCKEEYNTGRAPTREFHEPRLQGTPEPVRRSLPY